MIVPSLVAGGVTTYFEPILFLVNQYLGNFISEKRIGEIYVFPGFNTSAAET
jgi:hypothetical protein